MLARPKRQWSFVEPDGICTHTPNFCHPKVIFHEGNRYTIIPSDIRTWGIQRFACPVAASLGKDTMNETFECLLCTFPFARKEAARALEKHFWRRHCLRINIECPAEGCTSRFTTVHSVNRHLLQRENGVQMGSWRCRVSIAIGLLKDGVEKPSDDLVRQCAATLDADVHTLQQHPAILKQKVALVLNNPQASV